MGYIKVTEGERRDVRKKAQRFLDEVNPKRKTADKFDNFYRAAFRSGFEMALRLLLDND